jgi:hypothetical protein
LALFRQLSLAAHAGVGGAPLAGNPDTWAAIGSLFDRSTARDKLFQNKDRHAIMVTYCLFTPRCLPLGKSLHVAITAQLRPGNFFLPQQGIPGDLVILLQATPANVPAGLVTMGCS